MCTNRTPGAPKRWGGGRTDRDGQFEEAVVAEREVLERREEAQVGREHRDVVPVQRLQEKIN